MKLLRSNNFQYFYFILFNKGAELEKKAVQVGRVASFTLAGITFFFTKKAIYNLYNARFAPISWRVKLAHYISETLSK